MLVEDSGSRCCKGTQTVRHDMQTMKMHLTTQTKNVATYMAEKAFKTLKKEMATLQHTLTKTMATFDSTNMVNK